MNTHTTYPANLAGFADLVAIRSEFLPHAGPDGVAHLLALEAFRHTEAVGGAAAEGEREDETGHVGCLRPGATRPAIA